MGTQHKVCNVAYERNKTAGINELPNGVKATNIENGLYVCSRSTRDRQLLLELCIAWLILCNKPCELLYFAVLHSLFSVWQ